MEQIKEVFKVFDNLYSLRSDEISYCKCISKTTIDNCGSDGNSGETDVITEVYHYQKDELDFYFKLVFNTDSYGCNEFLIAMSLVEPKTKNVTVYE